MTRIARRLRVNQTDADNVLWNRIRNRQIDGHKFMRQEPIGGYICDFVCLEASMVIELDGSQHVTQAPYDTNRDTFLRSTGFRVLRFWNADVLSQTNSVVETIYEALHRPEMDGRFD